MLIDNKFNIGDTVYLKTDQDQRECLIVGIDIRPNCLTYLISYGNEHGEHYEIELSKIKNTLKKITDG